MTLKQSLKKCFNGWLPKEPTLLHAFKVSKPSWWRPVWIGSVLAIIISGFVLFLSGFVPLEETAVGLVFAFLCVGVAYYIRVKPSIRVNRALYILLGISPIGFGLWILYALSGIGMFITTHFGTWVSLIIGFTVPYAIGAFIGDWIGKRRNYQLPLSP
jgi:hypothetical protein